MNTARLNHVIWRFALFAGVVMLLLLTFSTAVQAQLANIQYTTASDGNAGLIVTGFSATGNGPLVIPSTINGLPVTSIGNEAFYQSTGVTSVTFPSSVTSIASFAFFQCSLSSVTIPASVTSIGAGAFYACPSLTIFTVDPSNSAYSGVGEVLLNKNQTTVVQYPSGKAGSYTIPNSVTSIGDDAFANCSSLTGVTIPDSVTSIGNYAFWVCTKLTAITIPSSVTSIGNYAFGYAGLTSVTIPTSVTGIGDFTFHYCTSLASVTIPASVTSLGNYAFEACTSLTSVTIPDSVTSIGAGVFSDCTSLTSMVIPTSVASIGDGAFEACPSLTAISVSAQNSAFSSVVGVLFNKSQTTLIQYPAGAATTYIIPPSVTTIGNNAFGGCSSLTGVTIPSSVLNIGNSVFYDCTSLTNVIVPDGVTSIGSNAFFGCPNLAVITSVSPNPVIGTNGPQAFTLNGSGFVTGCNVVLRDLTANQTFSYRATSSINSTQIVLNPNFTTSAHIWSVQIIEPNGSTVGQFHFNVMAPLNSWTTRISGTTNNLAAIFTGNGTIVAVGANGTISSSSDGITWTPRNSGTTNNLSGITYGNNLFVAVGGSGTILTSSDGINWASQTSGTTAGLQGIAYGDGLFVITYRVSSSITLTSSDGINWSVGTLASIFPAASIAFCGNKFLVNAGYYYTSPNGTTWTRSAIISSSNIAGFACGNDIFVAAGVGPKISTSAAGLTWTNQTSGTANGLLGVTYGNGFLAVGQGGTILSSADGISWASSTSGTSNNLNGAVYFNGAFLVVGNSGTILQSNSVPAAVPLISSTNPNPVPAQTGQQTFTINGSNLTTGCTVTLEDLGTGQSYPGQISSLTSSQIVLNQNFGTTPATWSVEVINSVGATSGQYQFQVGTGVTPTFGITATNGTTFPPVQIGSILDQNFTLTNNGATTIGGTATVTGPFTIVNIATYTLLPGQQQTFIVQFTPIGVGAQNGYLNFSGGTGAIVQLSGSGTATSVSSAFGTITGTITDSTTGNPVDGVRVSTMTGDMDTTALSLATGQDGVYAIKNVPPGNYILSATAPGTNYYYYEQQLSVTAGAPIQVAIKLVPTPTPSQTASLPLNIPVVFVRGLDPGAEPSQPDPYWLNLYTTLKIAGFVNLWDPNAVTSFYSNTSTATSEIIDGRESVDTNVVALKSYLGIQAQKFMGIYGVIPTINIVAHSMGCLIVREALNNQSYIQCPLTTGGFINVPVKQVIMLAPPNAGSGLADVAMAILNPNGNSSNDLQASALAAFSSAASTVFPIGAINSLTTSYVQNNFKYTWPNSLPCFLMAGTGGGTTSDPVLQLGNWYLITHSNCIVPETINDGAVTRPSVRGQYYDPSGNLKTCQTCVYLDNGDNDVTDSDALGESLDHNALVTDPGVQHWVSTILQTGALPAPVTSALSVVNLKVNSVSANAASTTSISIPIEQFDNQVGGLAQGNTAKLSVACDASTTFSINLLASAGGINFTLQDPSGNSINSSSQQTNPNVAYVQNTDSVSGIIFTTYTITSPVQGTWTVTLDGTGLTQSSIGYQLFVSGDSFVALQPTTAPFFHNNQEAVISCSLLNTGASPPTPVTVTSVTAQILYPDGTTNTQTLFDDGFHGDGAANDGTYATILPNLTEPGQYFVTCRVTGNYVANQPYTRYATGNFTVSTEDASIAGNFLNKPIPSSGSGVTASMLVNCLVNANSSGNYRLTGQLVDSTGTLLIPTSVEMDNVAVGATTATLNFDLTQFLQAGFTGTATLTNVQLFEQTANGLQWLDAYPGSFSIQIGPQITAQPQGTTLPMGGSAQMSVSAIGDGTLTYQWLFNGSPITGQTSASLSLSNVTSAQTGNYSVAITGDTGTVTSSSATLTVQALTTFSEWQAAFAINSPATTTPENDDVPNLLKYLCDINPTRPMTTTDRAALPTLGTDTTSNLGTEYLTLTYRQYALKTGITINVQTSYDLQTWTTLKPSDAPPDFLSKPIGADSNGDTIMEVGVKVTGVQKQFIRLNVTQP